MAADKNMFLKNYYFYGRHADMVNALVGKIDEDSGASVFNLVIEVFVMSAIVGVMHNHKVKPDSDKSRDKNIMAEQFNSHSHDVRLAFKFVTLLGNKDKYDEKARLNRTFRNPETDDNYREFEEYMLGGLEDIYNKLMVDSNIRYEDYLTSANQFLNEFKANDTDGEVNPGTDDFF